MIRYIIILSFIIEGLLIMNGVKIPRINNDYGTGVFFLVTGIVLIPINIFFEMKIKKQKNEN